MYSSISFCIRPWSWLFYYLSKMFLYLKICEVFLIWWKFSVFFSDMAKFLVKRDTQILSKILTEFNEMRFNELKLIELTPLRYWIISKMVPKVVYSYLRCFFRVYKTLYWQHVATDIKIHNGKFVDLWKIYEIWKICGFMQNL